MMSQSFTFIDPAGNQAQYIVYEADRHHEYHWSTDYGDSGSGRFIRTSPGSSENSSKGQHGSEAAPPRRYQ
jgi:hypothetical protein